MTTAFAVCPDGGGREGVRCGSGYRRAREDGLHFGGARQSGRTGCLRGDRAFPEARSCRSRRIRSGGGCELALACHLRIASENARFGLPEVGLGIIPGYGGTIRLSRLVGLGRAIELTLTGEMVAAERALQIGLVSAVVPRESLLADAKDFMRKITKNDPSRCAWRWSRSTERSTPRRLTPSFSSPLSSVFSPRRRTCGRAWRRSWRSGKRTSREAEIR